MRKHAHKYAVGDVIDGHTILEFVPKGAHWNSACYRFRCGKCGRGSFYSTPGHIRANHTQSCGCIGRHKPKLAGSALASATAQWTLKISKQQIGAWMDEGISTAHMAERVNAELALAIFDQGIVTKNAVIGRIHRLGLAQRKRSDIAKPVSTPFPAPGECLWSFGDPKDADHYHGYCAAPVAPRKPYCATHAAVAYIPDRPRRSEVSRYA